ncbi:hypothetical protein [Rummeliibacillus stabekisii]|uniref:Uncharacterized protein n=1 Tax=Rummeliibacillus stabekisii TaxID=241244 RepID=A0A143HF91_9BACL|nr:hypothetical protein [Rummeliibacillus stabekisii]AMX00403.1 hypothetical protein ATY39_13880 [Rummeliibacillus stabekisii]
MKGIVEYANKKKGFIAVMTENDDYSIVEVIDSYVPEIGSTLYGELENLGAERLKCLDDGVEFDVIIQDIHSGTIQEKWYFHEF